MSRSPVHLAYHYLGCARTGADGLLVPGIHGPLIEGFADVVERVSVVAWDPPEGEPAAEDRTEYLVPFQGTIGSVSLGPKGDWRHARERRRRVREVVATASRGWDVVAFRLPNRRVAEVATANTCPRVVCIDGSNVIDEAPHVGLGILARHRRAAAVALAERATRRVLSSSDIVFVNSELLARRHRSLVETIHVVPWSLRKGDFSFEAPDRITDRRPNVLLAGRVTAAKGVFDAFAAFVLLRERGWEARLHIVGDGDAVGELRRRATEARLDRSVVFHGWVPLGPELFALFRRMDVLLHLSYAESFPRVVWDALAHSVLTVCTPVGGLPYTLTDGQEVLFVPVSDPGAAADAFERLAGDPRLRRHLLRSGYVRARETDVGRVAEVMVERMSERWPELRPSDRRSIRPPDGAV